MASLSFKHIYKGYSGNHTAVKDFNLEVEDKELVVVAGPLGSGKTSILRMIAGLEEISQGELSIGDSIINDVEPKDRDIAMVFQNYALYPHMSVYENMAFGLKLKKLSKEDIDRKIREAAKLLDIISILDKKPKSLSVDQKHKVALGRAIVREPKAFLLDEPLSNIDSKLKVKLRTEISKLHKNLDATFIYVTDDSVEAMALATRIVVIRDGVIQQIDTPLNIYNNPENLFVAGFIGSPQMNFVDAKLAEKSNRILVVFGEEVIVLPEDKSKVLKEKGYVGKEVIFGIRTENIRTDAEFIEQHRDGEIKAVVDLVELTGADTMLYLSNGKASLTVKIEGISTVKVGDKIKIALDESTIFIFDKETEITIV